MRSRPARLRKLSEKNGVDPDKVGLARFQDFLRVADWNASPGRVHAHQDINDVVQGLPRGNCFLVAALIAQHLGLRRRDAKAGALDATSFVRRFDGKQRQEGVMENTGASSSAKLDAILKEDGLEQVVLIQAELVAKLRGEHVQVHDSLSDSADVRVSGWPSGEK
jgi:hypothetical protein